MKFIMAQHACVDLDSSDGQIQICVIVRNTPTYEIGSVFATKDILKLLLLEDAVLPTNILMGKHVHVTKDL